MCNSQLSPNWVYYLTVNNQTKKYHFEGYRTDKLFRTNSTWSLSTKDGTEYLNLPRGNPWGRHNWTTTKYYQEEACSFDDSWIEVTFSRCSPITEFSCSSGHCIDSLKRCDYVSDCEDKSDEKDCRVISIPDNYEKTEPPKVTGKINPIFTRVEILSVDNIDTLNSAMVLTVDFQLRWRDPRVTFLNIVSGGRRMEDNFEEIPKKYVDQMWLPLEKVEHTNAAIGKITEGVHLHVGVMAKNSATIPNLEASKEDRSYPGKENDLKMTRKYKIQYRCDFAVSKTNLREED